MARNGVTYEDYKRAADRLVEEGVKPTVRKVRSELGDTGTYSNLVIFHRHWEEERDSLAQTPVDLPVAVVDAIKLALIEVRESATTELEAKLSRVESQRDECQQLLVDAEEKIQSMTIAHGAKQDESAQRILSLEKQLAAALTQVEDYQAQNKSLSEKLEETLKTQEFARTEAAKAKMQVERADKATEKAEARMEELVTEASSLKKNLADAEKVAATATAVSTEQQKTIDRLDNELLEHKAALKEVTARAEIAAQANMASMKSQLEEIKKSQLEQKQKAEPKKNKPEE